jgi:hypothetical protein
MESILLGGIMSALSHSDRAYEYLVHHRTLGEAHGLLLEPVWAWCSIVTCAGWQSLDQASWSSCCRHVPGQGMAMRPGLG